MESSNRRARSLLAVVLPAVVIALAVVVVGVLSRQETSPPTSTEQANMTMVVIPVERMSCVACPARVKKSLTSLTGVGDVQVSLADRNARVRFDPSRLAPDRLVAAINGLGYQAGTPAEAK